MYHIESMIAAAVRRLSILNLNLQSPGVYRKNTVTSAKMQKLQFQTITPFMDKLGNITKDIQPCGEARLLLDDILISLAGGSSPSKVMDERIKKVIGICKQTPSEQLSAGFLSKKVNLSESRLTHLFKEQVGIPLRRYLLWQKLSIALMELSKGGSVY